MPPAACAGHVVLVGVVGPRQKVDRFIADAQAVNEKLAPAREEAANVRAHASAVLARASLSDLQVERSHTCECPRRLCGSLSLWRPRLRCSHPPGSSSPPGRTSSTTTRREALARWLGGPQSGGGGV